MFWLLLCVCVMSKTHLAAIFSKIERCSVT
jgi:hypothetical protein